MLDSYLKPLRIGALEFPTNLIQGPLAGYSCAPMRELTWQFGGVAYTNTEMLSGHALTHQLSQPKRYVHRSKQEGPLCVQISASSVDIAAGATDYIETLGIADLMDLNCGCPQPKIRKKGQGTKLLAEPEKLRAMIQAMKNNTDKPVTAKIRVDGNSGDRYNHDVVQALESGGVDAIIVHGRHWKERYDVACHVEDIADLVKCVSVPLIANGDVECAESLQHMFARTHCAGVMVSRATLGKPWLFKQLQGIAMKPFTLSQQLDLLWQHAQGLAALEDEYPAMLQSRKLFKYYTQSFSLPDDVRAKAYQLAHLYDLSNIIEHVRKLNS